MHPNLTHDIKKVLIRESQQIPTCFLVCMCICGCRCCFHACLCRKEDSLGCCSSRTIHLIFWDKVSSWPGAHWWSQSGWPSSTRESSLLSTSSAGIIRMCQYSQLPPAPWVLGIKLTPLCLHSKHFAEISPQPLSLHFKFLPIWLPNRLYSLYMEL